MAWKVALIATLAMSSAWADCNFDVNGTITNPQTPSCQDARFVFTENGIEDDEIALGYPVPMPVASLTSVDGFRTYDSLHAQHQSIWLNAPEKINAEVVGTTLQGRDIWAYRIGDTDLVTTDGFAEAAVMLNGGIHAREWQSPEATTEVIEQLIERAQDSAFGSYLHDNLNVVIVPVLNVDGFLQTQRYPDTVAASKLQPRDGRMRRKNMRHPSQMPPIDELLETGNDNFFGVDLNRNSIHGHGLNNASSADPVSLIYRGHSSASEPEIRALIQAATLGPSDRLRFYSDIHSFSQIFFTPATASSRRNTITTNLATRMRAVTGNKYAYDLAASGAEIGTTADYFADEFNIPAWTWEIEPRFGGQDYGGSGVSHSGFVLPDSEVARMRDEVTAMALLGFYRQVGPPRVTAVKIFSEPDLALVYDAEWISNATSRTLMVRTQLALLPDQPYRLWLAFDRPMRWRAASPLNVNGADVDNYPGQNASAFADLSLESNATSGISVDINGDIDNWIDTTGQAPAGYRRYKNDALSAIFTAPNLVPGSNSTALVLSIDVTDIALMKLDSNPATPADWQDGRWINYEASDGSLSDNGGVDCSVSLFVAADENAAPPAVLATCAAKRPPDVTNPGPTSSGGSGALLWLQGLLLLLLCRRWNLVEWLQKATLNQNISRWPSLRVFVSMR